MFDRIVSPEALHQAWLRARKGKRERESVLIFKEHAPARLAMLRKAICDGSYNPSSPRAFHVYEPKKRLIEAPTFRDRIVQHAIHAALEPVFEQIFFSRSYACRRRKGAHHGAKRVQADLRCASGDQWFLKTDFRSYFHCIDRPVLWREIKRKIGCKPTIELLEKFIPPEGTGLAIGALLSQLAANIYGHMMDRMLVERGERRWHRYMDDVVILDHGPGAQSRLKEVQIAMGDYARGVMRLSFSKWSIAPVERGINFLGYRIWPRHKLLRQRSVRRAKRRLRKLRQCGDMEAASRFVAAWKGHAQHADSANLLRKLQIT